MHVLSFVAFMDLVVSSIYKFSSSSLRTVTVRQPVRKYTWLWSQLDVSDKEKDKNARISTWITEATWNARNLNIMTTKQELKTVLQRYNIDIILQEIL